MYEALKKSFRPVDVDKLLSYDEVMALKNVAVVDDAHVMMVIAKTQYATMCLYPFLDGIEIKMPDLTEHEGISESTYPLDYIRKINDILKEEAKETGIDEIKIRIGYDYPMRIESENFIIMLAPRVQ